LKILFATSEIAPWVKTGGLGDVSAALPPALRAQGCDVRVLVPGYPALLDAFADARELVRLRALGGRLPDCTLREAAAPGGTPLLLLDCPSLFDRAGSPYLGADGLDWPDNHLRFGLLSRVAAWLGSNLNTLAWRPAVVHVNDWQAALAPGYLHYLPGARAKSVVTVHNLAFQGLFPHAALTDVGLPGSAWHMGGAEYYGRLSFLKAGLQFADALTTVSPTYAREIQTDAEGMGMAGLLRHRADRLAGILNGIDTVAWDPAQDAFLLPPFKRYDAKHLAGKAVNKAMLQRVLRLDARTDVPLLAVVSRLTHQKGLDLLADVVDAVLDLPAQLAVLGTGERALEDVWRAAAQRHPGRCAVVVGFDETLAHQIEAGADVFLMPSRFEPCGLNQMFSLRYGTPPVVRATGGLADTVVDAADRLHGNGFVFQEAAAPELLAAIERAVATWHDRVQWQRLQRNGMAADFSWKAPAQRYIELYRTLTAP
jgi:starch synthase